MKDNDGDAWKLPEELASFFNQRCTKHLKEKDLEQFLEIAPPENIKMGTKLDPFTREERT